MGHTPSLPLLNVQARAFNDEKYSVRLRNNYESVKIESVLVLIFFIT